VLVGAGRSSSYLRAPVKTYTMDLAEHKRCA
jgi:hypothetical protein